MRPLNTILIAFVFWSCSKTILVIPPTSLADSKKLLNGPHDLPLYDKPKNENVFEYYRVTILKQEARDDIEDFSIIVNTIYNNEANIDSAQIRQVIDLYFFSNGGVIYYTPNFRLKYLKKNPKFPLDFNKPLATHSDDLSDQKNVWDEIEHLKTKWNNDKLDKTDISKLDKYRKMKQGYITKYNEQDTTYTMVFQNIIYPKNAADNWLTLTLKFNKGETGNRESDSNKKREALEVIDIKYSNEVASQGSGFLTIKAVDLFNFGSTANPNSYFSQETGKSFAATLWFKRITTEDANKDLEILSKVDPKNDNSQKAQQKIMNIK